MSGRTQDLAGLIRHLLSFTGWRALLLIALMVLAAVSEGFGLLLLVPILAFIGPGPAEMYDSGLMGAIAKAASRIDVPLSLELVLAVFTVLMSVRLLIEYSSARLAANIRIDYTAAVRKEFFASIGDTSWRHLKGRRMNQLGQILLLDCWRIGEAALLVIRILSSLILMLANAAVAIVFAPVLATIVLSAIALLTVLFSNRLAAVQAQGRKVSEIQNSLYRVVEDYMDNLRVAKMAGAVQKIQEEFSSATDDLGIELSGFVKEAEWARMTLQLLGGVAVAITLLVAVRGFGAKGPELLLLILIAARFMPRISTLSYNVHSLQYQLTAFRHAYDALRECRLHPDRPLHPASPPVPRESIGVRGVTVTADEESRRVILDDVTLSIGAREVVAIEGPSGAGKSTLADVLSGLLLPDRGDICIDGEPLGEERTVSWRLCVGYVPQAAVLFQDTIRHNLTWALARPVAGADLDAALQCAEISQTVAGLPDGLETVVDRRQGALSGGERQRIAIARELLKRPQLLILDEATNALDVETEARVLANIRKWQAEMAVLIIAHRPSAMAVADRVVQMADGKISGATQCAQMTG